MRDRCITLEYSVLVSRLCELGGALLVCGRCILGPAECGLLVAVVVSCGDPRDAGPVFPCPDGCHCLPDLQMDAQNEVHRLDAQIWVTDEAPGTVVPPIPACYPECGSLPEVRWVTVPGGTFWTGCVTYWDEESGEFVTEECSDWSDEPAREATVRDFSITQTEITVGQFKAVMGFDPSCVAGVQGEEDLLPVECVELFDADLMCRGISGRLCSYIEWQRAAQGGDPRQVACNGEFQCLDPMAWYAPNSGGLKHPVGTKQPNGYGIYDMLGNVAEWVPDFWPFGGDCNSTELRLGIPFTCTPLTVQPLICPVGIRCCRSDPPEAAAASRE